MNKSTSIAIRLGTILLAAMPIANAFAGGPSDQTVAHRDRWNAADIGILNDGDYGDRVTLLPYRADELVLVIPADHPLARRKAVRLCEALAYDFVGAHPGSAINNQLNQAAAQAGLPLKLRIQVTSYDALCLMVNAGLGVGALAGHIRDGDVEAVMVQRLLQSLGLPQVGVQAAVIERVDAFLGRFRIVIDEQLHAAFFRHAVAQLVHLLELPAGIDMQ